MANGKIWQPIFTPFLAILPIIAGAVYLYGENKALTCDVSTQGELCGLGSGIAATLLIGLGILFAAISGLIIAIKYRKQIIWLNWALLWLVFIIASFLIISISNKLDKNYAVNHPYSPYNSGYTGQ